MLPIRRGLIALTLFALVTGLTGCASSSSERSISVSSDSQLPVKLVPAFSSQAPDRYMVNSGPSETYKPYAVNDWFKNALNEYAKIRTGGDEEVIVEVLVLEITTDYRSVGSMRVDPPATRHGGLDSPYTPQVENASTMILGRGARSRLSVPTEVWKTARFDIEVTIKKGDQVLAQKKMNIEYTDHMDMRFDKHHMAWLYDYTEAFLEAIATSLDRIGEMLEETVGAPA